MASGGGAGSGVAAPEERLLVLASLAAPSGSERAEAGRVAGAVRRWDTLFELADLNRVAPFVRKNLKKLGLDGGMPADVAARFDAEVRAVEEANEGRLEVARELFRRFGEAGIPVVILKGILFAETIYEDPAYKRMNDVDILVRMEDLDRVYEVYAGMDLFSAAELVGGEARRQEKFSHHAPPFFSKDLKCMIGTHWGLITPLAPYKLDYDAIWSRVEDWTFYGHPAKAMAPEDNLHHLCVHLPYYKTGVRELMDIWNLIRHESARLDWDLFLGEVRKAGTENLVFHALSLANRLVPSPMAEEAIRRTRGRTSWYFRRDVERKTETIGRLLRSRTVHLSRIEKAYGDLNKTKDPREMWSAYGRMWKNLLFPPGEDVARMNMLDEERGPRFLLGRLVTPWRIARVFARDVGGFVFVAILAKSALDTVKATLRAPLGADGPREDYAAFAERLGVKVEDIERLKDMLE